MSYIFQKTLTFQTTPRFIAIAIQQFIWGCIWTYERFKVLCLTRKMLPPLHNSEVATLCKTIASNFPFLTAVEFGINNPQAFDLLSKLLPSVKFTALCETPTTVVNQTAIHRNKENVSVLQANLTNVSELKDYECDIVWEIGILSIYDRKKAKEIFAEMIRVARRKIVLLEMQAKPTDNSEINYFNAETNTSLFIRDYQSFIDEMTNELSAKKDNTPKFTLVFHKIKTPLWQDKYWKNYGTVIECVIT